MQWPQWTAVVLAVVLGGWMLFDGSRAFIAGDYVTPAEGPYAGQLGPWSQVLARIGVPPRSAAAKGLHVVIGAAWLLSAGALLAGWSWARPLLLGCGVASLWYLPVGTVLGLAQIALAIWALKPR